MIDPRPDSDGASVTPFLAALAVIVLVVIGIGVMTWANSDEDALHESIVRAAIGQNDALQRLDYEDFRTYTCAQEAGTEAAVLANQRESVAAHGARYVGNVLAVDVDGDRATANVVYYYDNDKDTMIETDTSFVLEDGSWRVCSPVS